MGERLSDHIEVKIQPCPALEDLEVLWRALETRAADDFFLSWVWMGSWLEGVRERPLLLTAHQGDRLVGLGLLGRHVTKRHGMSLPTITLNQSGRSSEDSVFIEFNGFLVDRTCAQVVTAACLNHLVHGDDVPAWTECALSGVPDTIAALVRNTALSVVERNRRSSPYVALDSVRTRGGEYISHLSRNTRYQIRRSMKLYAEKGPLNIAHASSVEEAGEWLHALEILHEKSWTLKGEKGAFANPFFKAFCARLIVRGYPESVVDIVRVRTGSSVIGYLLNFSEGKRVMNYQSGFVYEASPHVKPGLTAHALVIQEALEAGKGSYSFLAGGSQYKSSLSNASENLYWLVLQKGSLLLRLERGARRVKSWARSGSNRIRP